MKLNKKTAFSLIELSIVVLIIGIIIAAVIGGTKLVSLSNLSKARALTNSSAVAGIEGLSLWLETTSKDSFLTGQNMDGAEVLTWRDINPQNNNKINATGVTTTVPLYTANAINGLPALRFDGAGDFFNYDGSFLIGTDMTIFIVEQKRATGAMSLIGGSGAGTGLRLGYTSDTQMSFGTNNNTSGGGSLTGSLSNTPRIHRFYFTPSGTSSVFTNAVQDINPLVGLTQATSYPSPYLARNVNTYYNGDIGEIIIFNRAISSFEVTEIEKYLSKKWGIKII